MFLLDETGIVINDPFGYNFTTIFHIYDTNYTSFFFKFIKHNRLSDLTMDHWSLIKDKQTENDTIYIYNTQNKQFVLSRTFFKTFDVVSKQNLIHF